MGELELRRHLKEPLPVLSVGLLQAQDVGVVFLGIVGCDLYSTVSLSQWQGFNQWQGFKQLESLLASVAICCPSKRASLEQFGHLMSAD